MAQIHVEESAISYLRKALETAGQDYKNNLARLQNLMDEITNGDIKGDPANDILSKFNAKRDTFNSLTKTIEEAEDYMGMQGSKFNSLIGDLKSGSH